MRRTIARYSTPRPGLCFNTDPADGGAPAPVPTPPAAPVEPAKAYPDDTPVAEMKPEEQAAYYRAQARIWEDQAKGKADPKTDYLKGLKEAADKAAELERQGMSAQEQAVAAAVEAAKAETRQSTLRESSEGTVRALLEGALTMRGHKDISGAVKHVNLSSFVEDGNVDHNAIVALADSLAGPATRAPDFGQGQRGTGSGVASGVSAGADMFAAQRGKQ